ncbi:hypothetical protein H0H87_001529, partial [Tephrocybe sp. NHM501043]
EGLHILRSCAAGTRPTRARRGGSISWRRRAWVLATRCRASDKVFPQDSYRSWTVRRQRQRRRRGKDLKVPRAASRRKSRACRRHTLLPLVFCAPKLLSRATCSHSNSCHLAPSSTVIHNIALKPTGPGILIRSAGSFGQVVSHEESERYTHVRLQSG